MSRHILLFFVSFLLLAHSAFGLSQRNISEIYGRYLKGLVYFDEGKYRESLREFERIKRLDPKSSYVRLKISFILVKLGEFDAAEKELKDVKSLDSDNLEASLALMFLYSYAQRNEELEKEYGVFLEKAHQLQPEDIRISEYLAQFYFSKKRIDEAIRLYEAIVEKYPDHAGARYLLGYFYDGKGERDKAVALWKKILKENPSHPETLNALGYTYAEDGVNLEEAEALIKKALEQDPDNGAYLDSLGWVYFQRKDYERAKEYLTRAADEIKDPTIYEHLGDLYVVLQDREQAYIYYKAALKLDPENVQLQAKAREYETENKEH